MSIKTFNDWVVLKPQIEKKEESNSGIYLPEDTDKASISTGEVISSADEKIKVGDVVLFKAYRSDTIERDGEAYLVLKSEDVVAKIN